MLGTRIIDDAGRPLQNRSTPADLATEPSVGSGDLVRAAGAEASLTWKGRDTIAEEDEEDLSCLQQ